MGSGITTPKLFVYDSKYLLYIQNKKKIINVSKYDHGFNLNIYKLKHKNDDCYFINNNNKIEYLWITISDVHNKIIDYIQNKNK